MRRIALAGRELGALASVAEILEAAPRIAGDACEGEASVLLAAPRGEAPVVVARWGSDALLAVSALEGAAHRALVAGSGVDLHLTTPDDTPIAASAAVLAAGGDRWVLFVASRATDDRALADALLDAVGVLLDAHLGRAIAGRDAAVAGPSSDADRPRAQSPPRSTVPSSSGARISFDDLLGQHRLFLECVDLARRAALSDMPILVTGETGTGKEMIAQAIHNASSRAAEPFVGINVAAIPRELLESELFGYERGAFTGARAAGKPGLLELAGAGTLLLDEIGDMSLDLQVKILRVLQERVVQRVGGTRSIPIHARTIATTHRDLRRAAEEGVFRADLYYRLLGVHVRVPALRDRPDDVPLLVDACLTRWAARAGRPKPIVERRVLAAYREHDWPGNVRELMHLVEAEASVLAPGETTIRRIPTISRRIRATLPPSSRPPEAEGPPPSVAPRALNEVERQAYKEALEHHGGNVTKAARALGVSRSTMYLKMRRYGLDGSIAGEGESE